MKGCKKKLEPLPTGRPRQFCGDACRKRAQRQDQKTRKRLQKDEWATPRDLFDELNAEFSFTLDAAATAENAKCARHYDKEANGLAQSWAGEVVFVNPPYSWAPPWIEKAYNETRDGSCTVVMLLRSAPGTKAWQRFIVNQERVEVRNPARLRFGDAVTPAPFDSAIVIFQGGGPRRGLRAS